MTTPIAYLEKYDSDPFSPVKNAPFCYWNNGIKSLSGFIVWSPGPDQIYDITIENVAKIYTPHNVVPTEKLINLTYDPSNGMKSRGDVYSFKQ